MARRTEDERMSVRFAVVYEAEADFRIATELADRVLVDAIEWLDEDLLDSQREWFAQTGGGEPFTWKGVKQLALSAGIRAHGHFDGQPGLPDAAAARRAILFLLDTIPGLNAIVLIRDQDDEPERLGGLEQARNQDHSGIAIIVGLAIVERECWVISGFEPDDEAESSRLKTERMTLGFDPRSGSHQLTACKDDNAVRSPKRVLRQLAQNERHRERRCWIDAPLAVLQERGGQNGLAAYLGEIRERLAALIGHVPT
jgi:hypothetical protein